APEARSVVAPPKTRWPPAVMDQPVLELAVSMLQDSPALVGRVSSTVTPWAVPAPELVTVTTKPMGSPAFTVALSATLVMWMLAQLTVIESDASSLLSLLVDTEAVLFTVPPGGHGVAVAEVAGDAMRTCDVAPEARSVVAPPK